MIQNAYVLTFPRRRRSVSPYHNSQTVPDFQLLINCPLVMPKYLVRNPATQRDDNAANVPTISQ